ncbi:MAG: LysR family substrate-binding domain-containing protein [Nocardioidaceae bacterium]
MSQGESATPFGVAFVTGVTPDKWVRTWRRRFPEQPLEMVPVAEDAQLDGVRDGSLQMAFVRLPVERDGLHLIPLYDEVPVVVVGKEHPVAAFDEVDVADLADEHLLQDPAEVPAWRDLATEVRDGTRYPVPPMSLRQAVESVAADAGILVLPMSVARVHQRKDVVAVPVTGVPTTTVGLAWPRDLEDPRTEQFVGVVRGRTERSSREEPTAPAPKKAAKQAEARKPARPAKSRSRGSGGRPSRRGRR